MTKSRSEPTLLANLTWSGLGQIVEFGLQFISSIILARWLGPEGRGVYAIIITVASLLTNAMGNNAVFSSLTFFIGKQQYSTEKVVGLAFWTTIVPAMLLAALVSGLPRTFLETLLPDVPPGQIWVFFLWTIQLLLSSKIVAMLAGLDRIRLSVFVSIVGASADLLFHVYFLIFRDMGLAGAFNQLFVSSLFRCTLALFVIWWVLGINLYLDWSMVREMLLYSGKYYPGSVSKQWLERADLYFIGLLAGSTAAGYYAVARGLATMVTLVEFPIRRAIIPKVVSSSLGQSVKLVSGAFGASFWLATFLAIFSALISPWLIPFIYGSEFVAAIPAYVLLLPATVFLTNLTIEVFFYYQLGRPEIPTLVVAGTAILGLPVYYLFTLRWGYLGTAFAFSLIAALRAGGMLIAYRHLSKQSFREILFIKRTEIKRGLHVINKTLPAIWHV